MRSRLIDAYKVKCDRDDFDTYSDYITHFDSIAEAPTIDAVVIRNGHPIYEGQYTDRIKQHVCRCSECGDAVSINEEQRNKYRYCPCCGARWRSDNA